MTGILATYLVSSPTTLPVTISYNGLLAIPIACQECSCLRSFEFAATSVRNTLSLDIHMDHSHQVSSSYCLNVPYQRVLLTSKIAAT